ncbi:hypothetical protein ACFVJ2_40860, partial [Rhodococcus jostii]
AFPALAPPRTRPTSVINQPVPLDRPNYAERRTHPVDLDPEDPAIAAALDEHIRGYEQQWLDDSIPALGGHTPRECAADPTRRDDLIRLLDSFPQQERPGAMSVRRLREALGL